MCGGLQAVDPLVIAAQSYCPPLSFLPVTHYCQYHHFINCFISIIGIHAYNVLRMNLNDTKTHGVQWRLASYTLRTLNGCHYNAVRRSISKPLQTGCLYVLAAPPTSNPERHACKDRLQITVPLSVHLTVAINFSRLPDSFHELLFCTDIPCLLVPPANEIEDVLPAAV